MVSKISDYLLFPSIDNGVDRVRLILKCLFETTIGHGLIGQTITQEMLRIVYLAQGLIVRAGAIRPIIEQVRIEQGYFDR